jgi:acyl carrier protein
MTNYNKSDYDQLFIESFSIEATALSESLIYQSIPAWDSVGHMTLIASIEEKFNITIEIDDIINFSSYTVGIEILKKYDVNF